MYLPGIKFITRPKDLNGTDGSCIDNFFIKSEYDYLPMKLLDQITDHFPILLEIEIMNFKTSCCKKRKKINYK